MSVLIVDDEESRSPIRELLRSLGYREIYEAPDWLQAMRLVEESRTRFRLMIAGHQSNGLRLLSEIRARRTFDPTAFVLTSSDLGYSDRRRLSRSWVAREALLPKPFSRRDLVTAINVARTARNFARDSVLCLTSPKTVEFVGRALADPWPAHWREALHAQSMAEADALVRKYGWRIGAVLVDPRLGAQQMEEQRRWLRRFRTSVVAPGCLIAALGNSGPEILPLRDACDQFLPLSADQSRIDLWHDALAGLSARCLGGWQLHQDLYECRDALRDGDGRGARAGIARMLAIDSSHAEAQCLSAEAAMLEGHRAQAIQIAMRAMASNPCLPKAYLLVLRWLAAGDHDLRGRIARQAVVYCPNHPEVLRRSADVLEALGDLSSATSLRARIPRNLSTPLRA